MKKLFTLLLLGLCTVMSCQQAIDERIAEEIKQISERNAGKQVDEITRMDSVTFDMDTRTVCYHYSLFGEGDAPDVFAELRENKGLMKQQLVSKFTTNPLVSKLAEYDLNYIHEYCSSSTGEVVVAIHITPNDYKKQ